MKKIIGIVFSAIATLYTIWYMHFGVPYKNSGALSKIGLSHHNLFVVWGLLTLFALCYNTTIAYRRYTKTKAHIPLLAIASIGMALTLIFNFDYNLKPDYYLHCVGSLAFSVIMGITIFVLFALCYKEFKTFMFITGAILIIDLICLLIFKETGLIEALPIFAGYLLLGIVNTRRDKVEIKR